MASTFVCKLMKRLPKIRLSMLRAGHSFCQEDCQIDQDTPGPIDMTSDLYDLSAFFVEFKYLVDVGGQLGIAATLEFERMAKQIFLEYGEMLDNNRCTNRRTSEQDTYFKGRMPKTLYDALVIYFNGII